jgi:hypothetical protein
MVEHDAAKAQVKEKKLEILLEYATACHIENMLAEYPAEDDFNPDFALPPQFDRRMKKLIAKYDRRIKLNRIRKKAIQYVPKAAIFLLILLGSLSIVVVSVQALRIKALNVILDIKDQYTSIETNGDNSPQNQQSNMQLPQDWKGYFPKYVPANFRISETKENGLVNRISYHNDQGQTIEFKQYISANADVKIDTENAQVQNIKIHNHDALVAKKDGLVSVVWKEDYLFSLIGEADTTEIIKMANSVQKNNL